MARTKTAAAAPRPKDSADVDPQPERAHREASSAKMERLRTLNQLLVKETKGLRDHLAQSRADVGALSAEHAVLSDLQSDVARILLASALADADRRLRTLIAEKAKAEASLQPLISHASSLSDALKDYEERLTKAEKEKEGFKKVYEKSIVEYRRCISDLSVKVEEVKDLRERLKSSDTVNREALEKARQDCEKMVADGAAKEGFIRSLIQEKESIESRLADSERLVKHTEEKMEEMARRKQEEVEELKAEGEVKSDALLALGEELGRLKEANRLLEDCLSGCGEAVDSLERQKLELQLQIGEMGKRNKEGDAELERLWVELGAAAKEREEGNRLFKSRMQESAQQIDDLMARIRDVAEEKERTDREKAEQEAALGEVKKELSVLQFVVSKLQQSCLNRDEANTQLWADNDSLHRELNAKREEATELGLQLGELTKSRDEAEEDLEKFKAILKGMKAYNENSQREIELLTEERASLTENLSAARNKFEVMVRKMKVAEMNSEQCLSMLKNAGKLMQGLPEGQADGAAREVMGDKEVDEEVRPFASELEFIKMAFRNKEGKIEELSRNYESLQCTVAEQQQKKGLWMWLYPAATTALAAASFAYAATTRGH